MSEPRRVGVHDVLRYDRSYSPVDVMIGDYLNFWHLQQTPGEAHPRMLLEAGINPIRETVVDGTARVPAVAIRSSPWRAGSDATPWHDEFDLDHGHIRYYGDHKPSITGPVGSTRGNKQLMAQWQLHGSGNREERLLAAPLLVFRAKPVHVDGKLHQKGHIEFCGVALIERLEFVLQRDPATGKTFPNLALDLNVLKLDQDDEVDFRWLDDRRNDDVAAEDTLRFAPESWRRWVREGKAALPRIRRRVMSSKVQSRNQQLPEAGSADAAVLEKIYRAFDQRKHAFEWLAALVAEEVMQSYGAHYRHGWLTKAGGDGGMDFVGRLDVGSTDAQMTLIVLGQAKCIHPHGSGVNADQVARLVARLQRGWIGVYVTTGVFTEQAQIEIADDKYPVVLVPGLVLAQSARRLAEKSYQGSIDELLGAALNDYPEAVLQRRPEEVMEAG